MSFAIRSALAVAVFLCPPTAHSQTVFEWQVDKGKVTVGQRLDLKDKFITRIFVLDYNLDRKCNVSASVITIPNSTTLGKYKSNHIKDMKGKGDQLRFIVDGRELDYYADKKYYPEKVGVYVYENGVEIGVIAPSILLSALENGNGSIEVLLGDTPMFKAERTKNFQSSNKQAFNYCMKNRGDK